jgi:hypothetical protein
MMKHRNKVKKALDEEMIDNYYWQDPTAWESLNHAKVDCKWTAIPEEMDLFPILAGDAITYDSGSSCFASVAAIRRQRWMEAYVSGAKVRPPVMQLQASQGPFTALGMTNLN